jgi:hypothetical protein
MKSFGGLLVLAGVLGFSVGGWGQVAPDPSAAPAAVTSPPSVSASPDANGSDPQAVALMKQMIAALGGAKWLALTNRLSVGRTSGFYQGKPTGELGDFRELRLIPTSRSDAGLERTEFTKQHDVVTILLPTEEWEITYKGKRLVPPEEYLATFRRRDHSLDMAVRVWWHEPGTVLFFGGQKMEERHLVDKVTLLDKDNDNIELQLDADTHLPLRVAFTWRDPLYKDQNEEAEEFADYHAVDGIPTPLNESFYHNGDMTAERYLTHVSYDVPVAPDAFDVDAAVGKIKR